MDLSKLDVVSLAAAGIDVELTHPGTGELLFNDKKEQMIIKVVGSDAKSFQSEVDARVTKAVMNAKGKQRPTPADARAKASAEILAKATLSWVGIQDDGKALPFSVAAAESLYLKYPWIKEQVDAACADRSQLFKE